MEYFVHFSKHEKLWDSTRYKLYPIENGGRVDDDGDFLTLCDDRNLFYNTPYAILEIPQQ